MLSDAKVEVLRRILSEKISEGNHEGVREFLENYRGVSMGVRAVDYFKILDRAKAI